jgi:eukaryotic-like serine/threonine-protein kinase
MHQESKRLFEFGAFRLDPVERLLLRGGDLVPLTPKAFELLLALVERHGHLVEKSQLMKLVWPDSFVEETNLSHHISILRSTLGESTNTELFIETVPRRGYRFVAPVREEQESLSQRAPEPKKSKRRWIAWAAAIFFLAVGSAALHRYVNRPETPPALRHRRLTFSSDISTFPTISSDGKLIAFSSNEAGEGNMDIWLQPLNGQATRLTSNKARDISPCFSPDGTQIAFRSDRDGGGIFVVSVFGGAERRLTPAGWGPRFSPDGKFISYGGPSERFGGDFYIVPAGGGQPHLVPVGSLRINAEHVWTPDGLNLVFAGVETLPAGSTNLWDWWIVPISGGQPRRMGLSKLLANRKIDYGGYGFPGGWRGSHIVGFLGTGGSTDLWEFETGSGWALTGRATQLTSGAAVEKSPRVSGNGRMVYYSDSFKTHLWKLPTNAGGLTVTGPIQQLTSDLSLIPVDPSSPARASINSEVLVFASARNGNMDIWTRDLRTGREAVLTASSWAEDQPVVSPDGGWVAYRSVEGSKRSVRVLNMSTKESRELCSECGEAQDWSRDSKNVVIVNNNSVWLFEAFGGQRAEVVRLAGTINQAALSPSGRLLAYVGEAAVGFVTLANRKASMDSGRGFPMDGSRFESLHWSASGDSLYFFSRKDDFYCLWNQRVDPLSGRPTGAARSVHHFHGSRIMPFTRWIAVGADGLVVRLTESSTSVWLASPE